MSQSENKILLTLNFFERKLIGDCPITREAYWLQRTMARQYREQISEAVTEYYSTNRLDENKVEFERVWRLSKYMIAVHYERAEIIDRLLKINDIEVVNRLAP